MGTGFAWVVRAFAIARSTHLDPALCLLLIVESDHDPARASFFSMVIWMYSSMVFLVRFLYAFTGYEKQV